MFSQFTTSFTDNHKYLEYMAFYSRICCCLVTKLCLTLLWPHGLLPTRVLRPWHFPGKNTTVAISSPGNLPKPGIKTASPVLAGRFFTPQPPGKFKVYYGEDKFPLVKLLLYLYYFFFFFFTLSLNYFGSKTKKFKPWHPTILSFYCSYYLLIIFLAQNTYLSRKIFLSFFFVIRNFHRYTCHWLRTSVSVHLLTDGVNS